MPLDRLSPAGDRRAGGLLLGAGLIGVSAGRGLLARGLGLGLAAVGAGILLARALPARRRPEGLAALTKQELYERAQRADLPGRSAMTKDELVRALAAR